MSKEIQLLKSKVEYCKRLINTLDYLNFISISNKYDEKIEECQIELSELYKRIQELKEVEINEWANNNILQQR